MILPSKLFTYKESVLSKMPEALELIRNQEISVLELFKQMDKSLTGVPEYMDLLDCLYALGYIEFDPDREVLRYVERN